MLKRMSVNLYKSLFISVLILTAAFLSFSCSDSDDDNGGGESYYLQATIDGTPYTFQKGFSNTSEVHVAHATYISAKTYIYAFEDAISVIEIGYDGPGFIIGDIAGNTAGIYPCTISYYESDGTEFPKTGISITIDTYDSGIVAGSIANYSDGTHSFSDITFSVFNSTGK